MPLKLNYLTFSFCLLIITFSAFSQQKTYLDKRRQPTSKKTAVYLKRHERENGQKYLRIYHLAKNKIIFEAQLNSFDPEILHGTVKEWNTQNILTAKGSFKNGEKSGIWKIFYKKNRLQSIYEIKEGKQLYHQVWNKYEKPLLKNGNGFVFKNLKGLTDSLTYDYRDSLLYRTYFIANKSDTIYYNPEQKASFFKGRKNLYDFLGNAVNYPATAMKLGVNGNVHLRFIIDELGKIENIVVTNGIGVGCDKEAVRVMMLTSGKWHPAEFNNTPVKSVVELPVRFLMSKR